MHSPFKKGDFNVQAELLQLVREKKAQPFHKRILLHNQFATNFSMYVRAPNV